MNKNKIISIFLIFVLVFVLMNSIFLKSSVRADSYRYDYNGGNLDERKYPGFKSRIDEVKRRHPSWQIKIMETGLDWNEVIRREGDSVGSSPRSLIQGKFGEWIAGNQTYDNGSGRAASDKAIAYIMDPRNWLKPDSSAILQFMQLSYFNTSDDDAKSALNGTFLDSMENARVINNVARDNNINVFFIIARIIQEQGYNGGATWRMQSDGKNYYNIFNINAYGNGVSTIVNNALRWAKDKGWDTLEKSLRGGISKIGSNYINQKQDTLYLQKFDVESKGGLYFNQYMQNVDAPRTEADILKSKIKKINGVLDNDIVLVIPVYKNMPSTPAPEPNTSVDIGPVNIKLTGGHTDWNVRADASTRARVVGHVANSDTIVLSTWRTGNGWHRVVLTNGVAGYIYFDYDIWTQINDVTNTSELMSVNGDDVAFRAGPGTSEPVIARLNRDSIAVRVDNTGRYNINGYIWDRVVLPDGRKGFIARNYLEKLDNQKNGYKVNLSEGYLRMRDKPNGIEIRRLDNGVIVKVLEKGTEKINNTIWDKVVSSEGVIGYVSDDYLVSLNGQKDPSPAPAPVPSNESIPVPEPVPDIKSQPAPTPIPENGNSELIGDKDDSKMIIRVSPKAKVDDLKKKYNNVKDISNGELGTGTKVKIDNKEYNIIKLGDINGDGYVDEDDAISVLRYAVDLEKYDDLKKQAGDVNKDSYIDEDDAIYILKYAVDLVDIKY